MTSFCTKAFAKRAGLALESEEPAIYGLGDHRVDTATGATCCLIRPCKKKQPLLKTRTIVIDQITGKLPTKQVRTDIRKKYSKLKLADEDFDKPGEIDFLIGADVFPYIYTGRRISHTQDYPVALDSIFGWVITGRCPAKEGSSPVASAPQSKVPMGSRALKMTENLTVTSYRKRAMCDLEGCYQLPDCDNVDANKKIGHYTGWEALRFALSRAGELLIPLIPIIEAYLPGYNCEDIPHTNESSPETSVSRPQRQFRGNE
ncbi:unnamed protein product [Bemisia tabaci]|uniref:Peptidase aspartic putative domain-containing protein n=1 Tax=Bemisia tabaci TaxID=7038 RepID=A0A9P0AE19_BEMTA|nr:unnamed protein product [Bemisia tabaci]